MISFEDFSKAVLIKTSKRRERQGLKPVTKPHLKRAYLRLTDDPKIARMSEDQQISYFTGYYLVS